MSKELRNEYLFSHSLHDAWDCEICRKYRGCKPTENHSRHCFNYSPKGMMEYEDDLLGWQVLNEAKRKIKQKSVHYALKEKIDISKISKILGLSEALSIIEAEQEEAGINYD